MWIFVLYLFFAKIQQTYGHYAENHKFFLTKNIKNKKRAFHNDLFFYWNKYLLYHK